MQKVSIGRIARCGLLGAGFAIGLVACGGDDDGPGGTPTGATTTVSTTSSSGGAAGAGGGTGGASDGGSGGTAGGPPVAVCGDGVVDASESCDDGNETAGDGCGASCVAESDFVCSGEPSVCVPICLRMLPVTPFDSSSDCSSEPGIDRVLGSERITWKGHSYLFVNMGNELRIYDIDDPQAPEWMTSSYFNVPNQGDSDYDLMIFSVCDDCRYGAAWFKLGTVLFDLGPDPEPRFATHNLVSDANAIVGGMTFAHEQEQMLVTACGLPGSCVGTTTLFHFTGIDPANDLVNVGCVESDTGDMYVAGGRYAPDHLYLADSATRVHLFGVQGAGTQMMLTHLGQPMRAFFGKGSGLAFDVAAGVAVEANSSGAYIWDISSPGAPLQRATIAGSYSRADIAYPFVFLAQGGIMNTEKTFTVDDLSSPRPLDPSFWNAANAWNHPGHLCSWTEAGTFSPDGSTLYLMRHSRLELVDLTSTCP